MDENMQFRLEVEQLQMKLQTQKDSVGLGPSLSQEVNKEADSPTATVRTSSTLPHSPGSEETSGCPPSDQAEGKLEQKAALNLMELEASLGEEGLR